MPLCAHPALSVSASHISPRTLAKTSINHFAYAAALIYCHFCAIHTYTGVNEIAVKRSRLYDANSDIEGGGNQFQRIPRFSTSVCTGKVESVSLAYYEYRLTCASLPTPSSQ